MTAGSRNQKPVIGRRADGRMTTRLRRLLEHQDVVVAPGCGDPITARAIEVAGFPAAYMSGSWTAGTFGFPDVGLATLSEVVGNAWHITRGIDIPVCADADTGYGSYVNVIRCVQEFERAGVAAIHLEDQSLPKKCGLMTGKDIVPIEDMQTRIWAACDARIDPDFVIIARSDALESEGLGRTIDRGHAYFDAGADMLFVEGIRTAEETQAVAAAFHDRLLLFNRTPRSHSPNVPIVELEKLGYDMMILPLHLILASLFVQKELLAEVCETGACDSFETRMVEMQELFDLLGDQRFREIDAEYSQRLRLRHSPT